MTINSLMVLLGTLFVAGAGFSEELQLSAAFKREEKKPRSPGSKANKRRVC